MYEVLLAVGQLGRLHLFFGDRDAAQRLLLILLHRFKLDFAVYLRPQLLYAVGADVLGNKMLLLTLDAWLHDFGDDFVREVVKVLLIEAAHFIRVEHI